LNRGRKDQVKTGKKKKKEKNTRQNRGNFSYGKKRGEKKKKGRKKKKKICAHKQQVRRQARDFGGGKVLRGREKTEVLAEEIRENFTKGGGLLATNGERKGWKEW